MLAAFAVASVAAYRSGWVPLGDEALFELLVRDVPSRLPLVGVYSRFGWSHPGPLQIWLLAVPYTALRTSTSLLVGTLVGHLAAVLAAWGLARRIDRAAGWTVLIALLAVLAAVPADIAWSPWNPFVALVAAGAVVVSAWAVAERLPWGSIGLVAFGSLLIQSHVVTLPLVAIVSTTGIALALLSRSDGAHTGHADRSGRANHPRDGDGTRRPLPRRSYALALGVGVGLWIGPIVDRIWSNSPNATLLQMTSGGERVGVADGIGVLMQSFAVVPSWLSPDRVTLRVAEQAWTVPVWLVLPIAGLVVAWIRRDHRFVRGSVVAFAALSALVVTSSLIGGGLFGYLLVQDGAVAAVAIAIGSASLLQPALLRGGRPLTAAALVVVIALSVGVGARQLVANDRDAPRAAVVTQMAAVIEQREGPTDRVVVQVPGSDAAQELAAGLLVQLERDGLDVRLRGAGPTKIGAHRLAEPGRGGSEWLLTDDSQVDDARRDGWVVVATAAEHPMTLLRRHRG